MLVQLWDLSKVIAALPKERIAAGQLAHLYRTQKALPGARRRRKLVLRPSYVDLPDRCLSDPFYRFNSGVSLVFLVQRNLAEPKLGPRTSQGASDRSGRRRGCASCRSGGLDAPAIAREVTPADVISQCEHNVRSNHRSFLDCHCFSPPLDFSITARLPSSDKYITKPVIGLLLFESQEAS